jgi:HSP20 family molecular chaperone IbpA
MSQAGFFTTLRSSDHDFIAALRFLDDYAKRIYGRGHHQKSYHHFVPRFDLEQHSDTYELYGELPGFRREDIIIEAHDDHNLQISGSISPLKSQQPSSSEIKVSKDEPDGTKPQDETTPGETSGEPSEPAPEPAPAAKVTPAPVGGLENTTTAQERYLNARFGDVLGPHADFVSRDDVSAGSTDAMMIPQVRHLISERHPCSFHRAFHFPTPIKKDEITATMQDGVLHILAKRAPMPPPVKVQVMSDLDSLSHPVVVA